MKTLKPARIDWRDRRFTFEKHFGAAQQFAPEYNADIGAWMPDQNADNRPSECTGYAVVDICSNEEGIRFSEDFNYMHTLEVMNVPPNSDGADLRTAAKVPVAIGLIPRDDEPTELFSKPQAWAANPANWPNLDTEAAKFKKPAYLPVSPITSDWFDAIRSALVKGTSEKRVVAVGTQWSPDFEVYSPSGTLPDVPRNLYWGHAYCIVGWKTIGGSPYITAKTWQGKQFGKDGYCYMSRTLVNKLMSAWGTYAFTYEELPTGTVDELKNQVMTLSEVIAALLATLQNLYIKAKYGLSH